MYEYQTRNGKYKFYTDEPLTLEEFDELDRNQEAVLALCELRMKKLPATEENMKILFSNMEVSS